MSALLYSYKTKATESVCYGTPASGRLENGVALSTKGKNVESYSYIGEGLGRTYVHSLVAKAVAQTYADLETKRPDTIYVFGETGWKNGSKFRPHKTHQNGLSVDFMVPVRNESGASIPLPCSVLNKWCYDIEFDNNGNYKNLKIDFEAVAEHLYLLDRNAQTLGFKIKRVIFDPPLINKLKSSNFWKKNTPQIYFSPHKPWVRHDEHYHVDFDIPCLPEKIDEKK